METEGKFKSGIYMRLETTDDGDIAEIIGEGEETVIENKFTKKDEWRLNLPVKIGMKELIWTPWDRDGLLLQKAWGTETRKWVGKKLSILHIDGKMIVRPIVIEKLSTFYNAK